MVRNKNSMGSRLSEVLRISKEEYERYRGRNVAIVRGRILCSGRSAKEAIEEALRRKPRLKTEDVSIYFIPAADELVV